MRVLKVWWQWKMNRLFQNIAALFALILASHSAIAETSPPLAPVDAITWKATMKKQPSTGITMGAFNVKFEQTTLDDVLHQTNAGAISHQGDAGESAFWLCYTNLSRTPVERIWLIAHGEMGGPEHHITSISAEVAPGARATQDCPALPSNMGRVTLDNGLWLNDSSRQVRAALGVPSHRQEGAWQSYDFQTKVPGNCEGEGLDLTNWLWLRLNRGRINSLQAGQVTSC